MESFQISSQNQNEVYGGPNNTVEYEDYYMQNYYGEDPVSTNMSDTNQQNLNLPQ